MHLIIGKHWSLSGLEYAFFSVTVHVTVARCLLPVAMCCVSLRSKLDFLTCDEWIEEARLLWHLLPENHTLL